MTVIYVQHTPELATLGQISSADLHELKAIGFKSVINNRPDGEGGAAQPASADLEQEAKSIGLGYAYLPVIPGQITPQQVTDFKHLLDTLPKPIAAFCRTGNRSNQIFNMSQT